MIHEKCAFEKIAFSLIGQHHSDPDIKKPHAHLIMNMRGALFFQPSASFTSG